MRTFTRDPKIATKWTSDDGVVIYTSIDRNHMSYEYDGNEWMIPYEWDANSGYRIYADRGGIRRRGTGLVVLPEFSGVF
jgi:hypothetical protein